MKDMPVDSVRGRIRRWIEKHAEHLGDDVLEIGTREFFPGAWWANNRDLARGQWLGVDILPGVNVDQVVDVHALPDEWAGRFSGVLCSEVMEHLARPWVALPGIKRVLQPGGYIIVTTLLTFPIHGYPDDYYRYTKSGLTVLLEDAGFVDIEIEYGGEVRLDLKDHDEHICLRKVPLQIFALAHVPLS